MNELTKHIAEEVREGWEGQHFTRNGEVFTARKVRSGGATDKLIEYAVDITEAAVREQSDAERAALLRYAHGLIAGRRIEILATDAAFAIRKILGEVQ